MCKVILFGGTTEGRELARFLNARRIPALVCAATEYGASLLSCSPPVRVQSGRLEKPEIITLLRGEGPRLVVDATHPYAEKISQNLREACAAEKIRYVRLLREETESDGCLSFSGWDELTDWLNRTEGMIFAATGAKAARDLTRVKDFAARVYLRMLPSPEGIAACLALGYPMGHLICLQGPVSEELNRALFRETGAKILVTKESGKTGGFPEKLAAAKACGMTTAILKRPPEADGLSQEEVKRVILEVCR
jgi:precorrin-6x reductase